MVGVKAHNIPVSLSDGQGLSEMGGRVECEGIIGGGDNNTNIGEE